MSSTTRKLGIAVILIGMVAPSFWMGLFHRQFPINPGTGEYYGTARPVDVFVLELAAATLPFAIAGGLLCFQFKGLVWQQRCILIAATSLLGLPALFLAEIVEELTK